MNESPNRWRSEQRRYAKSTTGYGNMRSLPSTNFVLPDTICQVLEEEGFTVERGLAGIPTCFTGTYVHGSGKPVMGILGEFDALSSLSQQAATTTPQPVVPGGAGHGCGHCSLGAGSLAAVLAIKDYLEQTERTELSSISAVLPRRLQAVHGARRTV